MANSYLGLIVRQMRKHNMSVAQVLDKDLEANMVDTSDIYEVTEYLEDRCNRDMDTVSFLMGIYAGTDSDYVITNENKDKDLQ